MSTCSCGLANTHFRCLACGSHSLLDSVPCWHCRYFKFEVVSASAPTVVEPTVTASPTASQKAKRRPRGVADQRN